MASYLKLVTTFDFQLSQKFQKPNRMFSFEVFFAGWVPMKWLTKKGLKQATGTIEAMIDDLLAVNAQQVENYRPSPTWEAWQDGGIVCRSVYESVRRQG